MICNTFENAFEILDIHEEDYVVIVTRGHKHDKFCLEKILSLDELKSIAKDISKEIKPIKGIKEIEKKLNITEEKINEILKTKKDNLDKISRDMDDKKLINKLKEDNDNIFKFEQNLYDVKFEIKKIINNNEYTPSKELEKLLDDIDLEERLEGLKDYYNSNSIKYNELLYKKPFNYIYKLFKLDAKNTFKIQVSEELEILKN